MPDIDDLFSETDSDSDLVKSLRKALKTANAESKEKDKQLADYQKATRASSLADVLKAKGLDNPKVLKLYPSDAETTPEAVDAWLGEYGELFGIEKQESTVDQASQDAARNMSAASGQAPPANSSFNVDALAAAIANAKTPAEYEAALTAAGITLEG